jgi:hypothetical protein
MMSPQSIRICSLALLTLTAGPAAFAQSKLLSESPFEPRRGPVTTVPEVPFEYVGFVETAEGFQFRLRQRTGKAAAFTQLDVPNDELGAIARSFDLVARTLTIEHQGRLLTLAERKAKVRPSIELSPRRHGPRTIAPAATMPPRVTDAVVFQPTPAQEAVRLEAVAAELKRRREERERAAAAAAAAR